MSNLQENKQTREEVKTQCLKERQKWFIIIKSDALPLQHKVLFMTQQK